MLQKVVIINGQKVLVPLSGSTPTNEVALNNMHSVTSNAVAKALNYFATEVNTGVKWLDGNDIYKLTIETELQNAEKTLNLSSYNISKVTKMEGMFVNTGWGGYWYTFPYMASDTNHILDAEFANTTNNLQIHAKSNVGVFFGTLYLSMFYTKTSN